MRISRNPSRRIAMVVAAAALLATQVLAHTGSGIAADRDGQVYFLDTGSGLWKIDTQGKPTHLSELRNHWLALDANDRFASTSLPTGALGEITRVGAKPTLLISTDYPIAIGQDGNLYYPTPPPVRIMRMLPSGETSLLATLPDTANGPLPHINGIAAGPDNSIYYTENSVIRKITAKGEISIAATVTAHAGAPSIPGTDLHPYLRGLAIDSGGVMYVADNGDARVLKITPEGKVTSLLQLESPWSPTAVTLSGSDLYVLEFLHTASDVRKEWMPRVRKIAADGKATIIMTVDQMPGARPAQPAQNREQPAQNKDAGFDPKRDAAADIDSAIGLARNQNKRALIVVGDNGCGWCRDLSGLFETNEETARLLRKSYIVVKVNMSPANENKEVLSRYPKIPGYPHLFVLDENGKVLESQRTLLLHNGDHHDPAKVIAFLEKWEPVP